MVAVTVPALRPGALTARTTPESRRLSCRQRSGVVTLDIGRPCYRAVTTLDALALIEEPPPAGAEGGSNSL